MNAHRGSVVAVGFVIDAALVGVDEARRRVLALWTRGAVVHEIGSFLILSGLAARRVRVERAPGTPLVEQHGVVSSFPLDRAHPAAAIVIASYGNVIAVDASAAMVDVATWIDVDDYEVAEVVPLASPPARAAAPLPADVDVRGAAGVGPRVADARDAAHALSEALAGGRGLSPPSLWSRVARWFSARIQPRTRALPAGGSGVASPSWFDRLRSRISLALWNSRLGETLGRRHAAYLRRLVEMFDRGELDEALRHAIPLGGGSGESRLALAVPRPRRDLALSLAAKGTSTSIPVAQNAAALIRDRYRAAVARLEQQGRIDEAAFVLADLLADAAGAIALLERHRRFELAAKLAEARKLEPGLVVRLWFLAGDAERAVTHARQHRAWGDAVARLERSDRLAGQRLRVAWADHLASTGDYVQAVEVASNVPEARLLALTWIDHGIAAGGTSAARLLIKKLSMVPATFGEVRPSIVELLDDRDPDAQWRRLALVDALLATAATPELRTIARASTRAILGDIGRGADGEAPALLPRLLRYADDAALRADQPVLTAVPHRPPLVDRDMMSLRWSASDTGAVSARDAAVLPDGRLLVALGELGVRIIGRDGRTTAHFEQPATRLVVDDHGTRALAYTTRGTLLRVARIDLASRRAAHWCDAECDGGATTFDGGMWLTTRGSEVLAIDTLSPRWTALWGVDPELGRCLVHREGDRFAVETATEAWFYERLTLRRRGERLAPPPGKVVLAAVPRAASADWVDIVAEPMQLRCGKVAVALAGAPPAALDTAGRLAVVTEVRDGGISVSVIHLVGGRLIARFDLDGATTTASRLDDGTLTLCDDRGRVIVIDLRAGAVTHDVRLGL